MNEFLNVFSVVSFVILIITSVITGFSLAINLLVNVVIKKINACVDKNYLSIESDKREKCNEIIYKVNELLSKYVKQNNKIKKVANANKIRKIFKIKEKQLPENETSFKGIIGVIIEDTSKVFYNSSEPHLKFSEVEIYKIILTLKNRIKEILSSTGIIWLKQIPLSFVMICINLYGKIDAVKNKPFVLLIFKIVDFCLKFTKLISPMGVSKIAIKSINDDGLNSAITSMLSSLIVKELSVIYNNKANKV